MAERKISKPALPKTTTDDARSDIAEPKTFRRRRTKEPSAAKSLPSPHSDDIEQWFFQLLVARYSLPPGRISRSHPLAKWGYANANDVAALAGEFNRFAYTRPRWNHATVTPPELIDAVFGGTIEQLLAFLSGAVSTAAVAQRFPNHLKLETVSDTNFSVRVASITNNDTAIADWFVADLKRYYPNDVIDVRWKLPTDANTMFNLLVEFEGFVVTSLGIAGFRIAIAQIGSRFAGKTLGPLISYLQKLVRASQ